MTVRACSSVDNVGSFPLGKRQGREADHPTSCIIEVKNERSCATTSPVRLQDVHGYLQLYLHRAVAQWLNCGCVDGDTLWYSKYSDTSANEWPC